MLFRLRDITYNGRDMKGHSRIDSHQQTSCSRRYNLLVLLLLPATILIVFSPFYIHYLQYLHCDEDTKPGGLLFNNNHISTSQEDHKDRILVVYAGPSSKQAKKVALYEKNLEFFLNNGIDCKSSISTQVIDTIIVVGHEFYDTYSPWIQRLNLECQKVGSKSRTILISRRDICYDIEAPRLALYGGVPDLNVTSYDYFIMVNCGTTGPPPPSTTTNSRHWTYRFLDLLDNQVKMTGLNLNCEKSFNVHIQSMMWAVDRIGLELIMKAGAIFDCLKEGNNFISYYEKRMGHAIMNANYSLRPAIGKDMIVNNDNSINCAPCSEEEKKNTTQEMISRCNTREQYRDIWIGKRLKAIFNGRIPMLEDVGFFKTSRYLSPEMAKQINYTGIVNWNWN